MSANPMEKLDPLPRRRTLPRVLTRYEVGCLLDAAESRRDRALIQLPLDNGLRVGEIASLRWPGIGLDYAEVDGKTGKRRVPLSPSTKRLLLGLGDGEHVWTGRFGPLTRNGVQKVYRDLFAAAGLVGPKLGPHTLRHTFGTWYIRGGGNVKMLQEILGHSRLETTMLYIHLAGVDVAADHARHSPLRSLGLVSY